MPTINDPPERVTRAGLDFNFATWTAETVLTLCRVPWDSDYRDVVHFDSRAALDAYLDGKATTASRITQSSYARVNMPIRIAMPFNAAITYNYIRAFNPSDGRAFYYFILDARHIAPGTTELIVQLDVWQSYAGFTLGNVYVERGHISIANENNFEHYGRRYLTVPEGFDTGSNLPVIASRRQQLMGDGITEGGGGGDNPRVQYLIASTISLDSNTWGNVNDPKQQAAKGTRIQNVPVGVDLYVADSSQSFINLVDKLKDYPWISRGIISVTALPIVAFSWLQTQSGGEPVAGVNRVSNVLKVQNAVTFKMFSHWRDASGGSTGYDDVWRYIEPRYRHLKKFFTYPYCAIELTTWTGTPLILRPELWQNSDLQISMRGSLVPGAQKLAIYPTLYNAGEHISGGDGTGRDAGEYLDMATLVTNMPSFMVTNDNASLGLAMSAHSIAYAHQSADWSQQRALAAAQTGYDQANMGLNAATQHLNNNVNTAYAQNNNANQATINSALISNASGIIGGTASGAASGGPMGAATGMLGGSASALTNSLQTVNSVNASRESTNISAGAMNRSWEIQQGLGAGLRDSNKGLADWAARGDYANTIAGINASVQDTQMAPPTTQGQLGGEMLNMVNRMFEVSARIRMVDKGTMRRIGEYWLRYGYAVNEYVASPPIMVMNNFTYWKLLDCYIVHDTVPQDHRLAIRGIFERGVTVWSDAEKIGRIDFADNEPIKGITYG